MVRTVNHSQGGACPFAQGDGGRHTNWSGGRDAVSGLHCGGPVTNMQAHQTPLMQQFGGVPPRAPATFNPTASHGDTLDQFAQKTQRDVVYEAKRQAHKERAASRGGSNEMSGRGAGAQAVQPRRRQEVGQTQIGGGGPPQTGMSEMSQQSTGLDFGAPQQQGQVGHGRRKSTAGGGDQSGVVGMFGNAPTSARSDIQQGRRKSEEKVTAQWMQEAESNLAPQQQVGGGGINCSGSNCSSGGYRVLQPSGGASSFSFG